MVAPSFDSQRIEQVAISETLLLVAARQASRFLLKLRSRFANPNFTKFQQNCQCPDMLLRLQREGASNATVV